MKKYSALIILLAFIIPNSFAVPDTTNVNVGTNKVVQVVDNRDSTEVVIIPESSAVTDTTNIKIGTNKVVRVVDDWSGTEVVVGQNGAIIVDEKNDTVKVKIGKRGVKIIDSFDGTQVEFLDEDDLKREFDFHPVKRFRGHWAGFELGLNNYLTPSGSFPSSYLTLNSGKSWNVNINFIQYSINISNQNIGLVTGLGFQMNDYKFSGNNSIEKDENGNIIEVPITQNLKMSKFHANYLSLPLIFEFHLSPKKYGRKLYVGVGVIGTMKLWSYTKIKYYDPGKLKAKKYDDLSISPWQAAVTLRAGFKFIKIFVNYNLNTLFLSGKAEPLYPISAGLVLLSF